MQTGTLTIAGRSYPSRLIVGTGKYPDWDVMRRAIEASGASMVTVAVRRVDLSRRGGESLLDPRLAAKVMAKLRAADQRKDPLAQLTAQEHKVLDLIGEGLTNRQIAERMFLAEKTVKNYVSNILAKLGLERRTQAAVLASKLLADRRH